jgi:hypothetical protein
MVKDQAAAKIVAKKEAKYQRGQKSFKLIKKKYIRQYNYLKLKNE